MSQNPKFKQLSAVEFDATVSANDLCMAFGLILTYQKKSLKHFIMPNGAEMVVNLSRNEACVPTSNIIWQPSQLAREMKLINGEENFSSALEMIESFYNSIESNPVSFPYSVVSSPVHHLTDNTRIQDRDLTLLMNRMGISKNIGDFYGIEGSLPNIPSEGHKRVLAFPVYNESESYIAFDGKSWRQIGEAGMSTFHERRKDQVCMVYENILDFLAMMEMVTKNGVAPILRSRFHLVTNGERGLEATCQYLKSNPDFLEVKCLLSDRPEGRKIFRAIHEATKGTAIDRKDLLGNYPSIVAKCQPKRPQYWQTILIPEEPIIKNEISNDVSQQQAEKKLQEMVNQRETKTVVYNSKSGGLKM
ncbi:MAG: hypothetical protein J1F16_07835 [Muribaculaceae bacterium]|nr:hypothetical protein [Muribaculaceae bacterium]